MSTYVMSDIHGEYGKFVKLLGEIGFCDADTLYVLGDVVDRGPHPIKCLKKLMQMPNAFCIAGNHELMALECLGFLTKEITEESINALSEENVDELMRWTVNGNNTTLDEFYGLDSQAQREVIEFMSDFSAFEELEVNGQKYLLVHAGLENFSPDRPLWDYAIDELVWERADLVKPYFDDIITITGHTPTQRIEENPRPGCIYRANNRIAIDCGACFKGGRLAALCLETGEEFYA